MSLEKKMEEKKSTKLADFGKKIEKIIKQLEYKRDVNKEYYIGDKIYTQNKSISTIEIEKAKCPGFTYFLEMFLIKELMEDLENSDTRKTLEEKIDHVIYYAEYDA